MWYTAKGLKKNLRDVAASLACARRASAYRGCVAFWIEYAFNGFSPIFTDMSEVFSKAEDNRAPRAAARHPVPVDLNRAAATARYGDGGEASPCARHRTVVPNG